MLPAARQSTAQIADAGGWGGTDPAMLEALGVFAAHLARDDPATRHVLFGLSEVVTSATTPEQAAALGSDYDFATPRALEEVTQLLLSPREWQALARNCAPWAC